MKRRQIQMKIRHIPNLDIYAALDCDNGITLELAVFILSIKNTEMSSRGILYLGDSEDDDSAVRKVSVSVGINSDKRLTSMHDC
jgi:hypothetical protein